MDVWLDSGVAWHCAANDDAVADLVVEGDDQFRGWFQSLLWTSVAAGHGAPYRRVLVHGFCVDDDERKMSKSLGNVVDPDTVRYSFCVVSGSIVKLTTTVKESSSLAAFRIVEC